MLGTFPNDFSQVATSQVLAAALGPQPVSAAALGPLAVVFGPHCSLRRLRASEGLTYPLGSYRLGNCTFGKLPLGKNPLGKCLTSFYYDPTYNQLSFDLIFC